MYFINIHGKKFNYKNQTSFINDIFHYKPNDLYDFKLEGGVLTYKRKVYGLEYDFLSFKLIIGNSKLTKVRKYFNF